MEGPPRLPSYRPFARGEGEGEKEEGGEERGREDGEEGEGKEEGEGVKMMSERRRGAVSYTHLRAHETEADL
eukprot:3842070-Rhodomonas_salina.1